MEIPTWISYAAAWLATVALLLLSRHLRCRKVNLPPGPKPWPIIGNLNLIGPLPHRSLRSLSQKYGPLMHLKFGSIPVTVGSSFEMAKDILKTHDVSFASRPKTAAGRYTTYNYSDITWAPYGPYWRQARKLFIMELFTPKSLGSYEYIRKEELNALLKNLFMSSGKPIIIKDHFSEATLNVISRVVLGKTYTVKAEEGENEIVTPDEFRKMLEELLFLNGVLNIGDSIPWLAFLDLQGYNKRMKAVNKKFDRFLEHVLDDHNARKEGVKDFVPKDMVDVLLQLSEDPHLEVKLQRHHVKALTLDLLVAGTETSAVTIEWAMSELLKKPEIIEKARDELDRVIGKERWVEEKDIVNLPLIEAIVKETMRTHPLSTLLVPRLAREDVKLASYDIAKGTYVLVNVWAIGRDPKLWDNPDEFCPERFIGKAIDVKGHDFELLPFGAGRRMCPGYPLGLKVVQTSLANLLHGFKWKLPGDMKNEELNMEEIFGLTTIRKIPLVSVVEPRLPAHLYFM